MADFPFCSSQESQHESLPATLLEHDILPSSPLKARSDAAASLRSSSLKPKKPPTVTPNRFNKFFTPRTSSLSGRGGRESKSGRQLRDITRDGNNRRRSALGVGLGDDGDDLFSSRPLKRRKQSLSFDVPSSPPQSSPLRKVEPVNDRIDVDEDDGISVATMDDDSSLPDLMQNLEPFPQPIQRLRHTGRSHRILQRSFGGYESTSRGFRGPEHCVDWRSETADFVSLPTDRYSFRGDKALPFATAGCNTNPLVAFADEEGNVRLLDTSAGADFTKAHVTFKVHSNAIMDIAFSPDDYMLATASGDQTARVVDMHTQKTMYILSGHKGSLKQIRFHPNDDRMLTTSSRDGSVQIWDLRCSTKTASQILRPANSKKTDSQKLFSKVSMDIGRAHRITSGKVYPSHSPHDLNGVSITAFQHLGYERSHMLATASEANSCIKVWDLRNTGRRSIAVPVSTTPMPEHHQRNFGIGALALSGDGSRLYSVSRDSVVYAYSTNHLALGCSPELSSSYNGRRAAPKEGCMGVGPLYGYKHDAMRVGSFYVRAAIRTAKDDKSEMLAIGSSDHTPVLIPTDERHLPFRNNRPCPRNDEEDEAELPSLPGSKPQRSRASVGPPLETRNPPIYEHFGTALVRGHTKEVSSLTFTSEGNLVTIGDDFRARCWREDRENASRLRKLGEGGGRRWACGWADVPAACDESDEELA